MLPINKKEQYKLRNVSPRTKENLKVRKEELRSGDEEEGKEWRTMNKDDHEHGKRKIHLHNVLFTNG